MTVWYSLYGSIETRACSEVEKLVEGYCEEGGEICADYEETGDGLAVVTFHGGEIMTSLSAEHIDDNAKAFGPYVTHGQFLGYDFDGERGKLYIGPEEDETAAKSKDTLDEIKALLCYLTADDAGKLAVMLKELKHD